MKNEPFGPSYERDFSYFYFICILNIGNEYSRTNSLPSVIGYSSGTRQLASEAIRPVPDDRSQGLFFVFLTYAF